MEETTEPSQFSIRLPSDVRQYLHNCANKHGRSLNSEILKRLEYSISLESDHENNLVDYMPKVTGDHSDSDRGSSSGQMNDAMLLKELMTIRETLEYLSSDKHSTDMVKMILRFLARKV